MRSAFELTPPDRLYGPIWLGAAAWVLTNSAMSPLFAATAEATEEAVYNAIFKATTVSSSRGTREAIPLDELISILERHDALNWHDSLPPVSP